MPAPASDEVPVDDLVGWLADMIMIRRFEEVADDLSLRGKIAGGIHPAIGQEAVAAGTVRALRPEDVVRWPLSSRPRSRRKRSSTLTSQSAG